MLMTIMGTGAVPSSYVARHQPFWIENPNAAPLARYVEDGRPATAVRKLNDWTSVYLGAPYSLGGDLLHNIAKEAGAFTCGPPGQMISYSDRFISLHALCTGTYTLRPPHGTRHVLDAETNAVLASGDAPFTLTVEAQRTYWFVTR